MAAAQKLDDLLHGGMIAAPSTHLDELLLRNKEYAKTHVPFPTLEEIMATGQQLPRIALLTCCDGRSVPEHFFNVKPGERPFVAFRNNCGHAERVMQDLVTLNVFLKFESIVVIHHEDCGSLTFTNHKIVEKLKEVAPEHTSWVDGIKDFGGIKDIDQSIKDDVAILKSSPFLSDEQKSNIRGFNYDIQTGLLREVL